MADKAFKNFISEYPVYLQTGLLDRLREQSFQRLGSNVYLDYMGGCLSPDALVKWHAALLQSTTFGNTHSMSPSSQQSSIHVAQARKATLEFFDAPQDQYLVIFTSSATAALKLVGESFPFTQYSQLVLPVDAHNSVHGIRCFASSKGAKVTYLDCPPEGGLVLDEAKDVIQELSRSEHGSPSNLFIFSGQSNITNSRTPLTIAAHASKQGFHTLLDAAALAPTCPISLRSTPVDAMAISFYKMFGYPTGVGALVIRREFAEFLSRTKPWFAGGTVDLVQVPGKIVTLSESIEERFEEGTINYLSLPVIPQGLTLLKTIMPVLRLRLPALTSWLVQRLEEIQHPNGQAGVVVLSRRQAKSKGGESSDTADQLSTGSTISMLLLDYSGTPIPLSRINDLSSELNISLRTGCMCNPGGAAALLESHLRVKTFMRSLDPSASLNELEKLIGYELGVVRLSLGMASNWNDVNRFLEFTKAVTLGDMGALDKLKSPGASGNVQQANEGFRSSLKERWRVLVWKHLRSTGAYIPNSQRF